MTALENKLHDWVIHELNLLSEGRFLRLPQPSTLARLITTEKNKRLWNHFVNNVRSQSAAQKIRRVLKAKHAEEDRERNLYLEPICFDPSGLHKEILKADEKCTFLESSLSETTERVLSIEQVVRELRNEIDKLKLQSAFLETFIRKYKEKTVLLKALNDRLASEKSVNEKKIKNSKNIAATDPLLNHLLHLLSIVVKKELKRTEGLDTSIESINRIIDEKTGDALFAELIFKLRDISKTSYSNILKDMIYFSKMELDEHDDKNTPFSYKHLEDMKMQHVHSVITTKKMKMETKMLQDTKEALVVEKMESVMINTNGPSLDRKFELFERVLEIKCIEDSIKCLETFLCEVQNKTVLLREKNNHFSSISEDLKIVVQKFYQDFDLLCQLLKWAPCVVKEILEFSTSLCTFINKDVFCSMNSQTFPSDLINNLSSKVKMFWDACEHNNIIKSPIYNPFPQTHSELALWSVARMQQFHNTLAVVRKVKLVKEKMKENQKIEFLFDAEKSVSACHDYGAMINVLQEMQAGLEAGGICIGKCSQVHERTKIAIKDWWRQGAQYTIDLSHEDKTLRMWQDVLKTLSNFHI